MELAYSTPPPRRRPRVVASWLAVAAACTAFTAYNIAQGRATEWTMDDALHVAQNSSDPGERRNAVVVLTQRFEDFVDLLERVREHTGKDGDYAAVALERLRKAVR